MKYSSKTAQWIFGGLGTAFVSIIIEQSFCSKNPQVQPSFEHNSGQIITTQNNSYFTASQSEKNDSLVDQPLISTSPPKKLTKKTKSILDENSSNKEGGVVNVTSINQTGGITANKVYIDSPQRELVSELKTNILNLLPNKDEAIQIESPIGHMESITLAKKVVDFLKSCGYKDVHGIDVIRPIPFYDLTYSRDTSAIRILIGPQSK